MKFVIYKDTDRQFRWRLYPDKGMPIAASAEAFRTYDECVQAIALVREAAHAPIEDHSFAAAQ